MLLIGVGGVGSSMARGVSRAYGDPLRYLLADTDATSGSAGDPFILLGGGRLAGRGSGGDTVAARMAAEESVKSLDEHLECFYAFCHRWHIGLKALLHIVIQCHLEIIMYSSLVKF